MSEALSQKQQEELFRLADRVIQRQAGGDDLQKLERLLAEDDRAQQVYLAYLDQQAQLQWMLRGTASRPGLTAEAELHPRESRWERGWNAVYDFASNYITLSMLVSGLFLTIILLSMALWDIPEWQRPAPPVDQPSTEFVARITASQQATFDKASDGNLKSRDLFDDDQIVLASGLAVIEYDTGAKVILEGPCEFALRGANAGSFLRGKLAAEVPRQAIGFFIETPFATVVDLGTEFGLRVGAQATHVEVYQGEVRMESTNGSGKRKSSRISAGETAMANREGEITVDTDGETLAIVRHIPSKSNRVVVPSQTGIIATASTGANNTFSVSSTDAADASQGGTTAFTGTADFGSNPAKVIDGGVYNSQPAGITFETLTPSVGSELILNLDPSASAGWDISSIVVLTGVAVAGQGGRSDHSYTIALSTDGSTFGAPIINVDDATTADEVQVTVLDDNSALLGTGVKAVKFVFGNATRDAENMYREIDVVAKAASTESIKTRKSTRERNEARPSKVLE